MANIRRAGVTALMALCAGLAIAGPAAAQPYPPFPPPPREGPPPARPGGRFAWEPGHWQWIGGPRRYVWVGGHWVERVRGVFIPGHWARGVWVPPHWG